MVTGFLIAAGVWLAASIPFALWAGHVLAKMTDDYPPVGDDGVHAD